MNGSGTIDATAYEKAVGLNLTGNGGVSLLSIGTSNANLSSSDGDITAIAGDVASYPLISAPNGNVSVTALSSLSVPSLNAGGDVNLVAGGDLGGYIGSGQDATVVSLGNLSANVNASGDASLFGMSGLTGIDSAGNDLQTISYGTLGGSTLNSFTAGHDITQLWARGNILGTFTADHSIGSVSAYGSINGTFTAGTSSGTHDSTFGQIGSVTSWGNISGNVTATVSSGPIQSQGNITATISPSGTSVTSNATGLLGGSLPATPDFSLSDAQAALSDASGNATTLKQSLAASEASAASDWASQQATLATQLTQLQQDDAAALQSAQDAVTGNNAAVNTALQGAQADDQTALTNAVTATNQAISAAQSSASTQLSAAQAALSQGTAAVAADQASLTATQTQEKSDATKLTSAEATAYQNETTQQQNLLQGGQQQFVQQANQIWSNLGNDIWNATTFYRQVASDVTHTTLQVISTAGNLFGPAGFIVGRVADLANAGLYYEEGSYLQAGFSAIAALPLIGSAASLSVSEAESVGDGLLATGTSETASVDNAIAESTITEADAEMANAALEAPEETAEGTVAAEGKCVGGNGCFVAGTEVIAGHNATTGAFSQTPIQDIQVGDEVVTRNQYDPTGPLEEQTVTATEQHTAYDLREVMIQGPDGSDETIQVTDEHPFFVEGQGFTGAAQLTSGEQIETADGTYATVVSNTDEPEPNGVTVYNFTVGTDHTYFVDQSGVAVWVHNTCADARELRNNLIDNLEVPDPGDRAAHIVPTGGFSNRSAEVQGFIAYSQQVLEGAGIGLNDAENGFFTASASHIGTHTDEYFEGLAGRLAETDGSTEEVLAALQKLKNELTGVP